MGGSRKHVLAFDADDVLLPTIALLEECASEVMGRPIRSLTPRFDLKVRFGLEQEDVAKVFALFQAELHRQPIMDGVAELLNQLQDNGWCLQVVTAIPDAALEGRRRCFARNGVSFTNIHASGHHGSKKAILASIAPKAFFDDRLTNLAPLEKGAMHRVWIEHPHEIQCIDVDPNHFDDKASSVVEWFARNPSWMYPPNR